MANVTGVSQLMETAGVPATQTASTSTAPAQSFATAMQQANTDAGVSAAPVVRKPEAKQSDASQTADKQGEPGSFQAGIQPAVDSGKAKAPVAATPQTSMRYTPANMLAAMLNHAGTAAAANTAVAVTPPLSAATGLTQVPTAPAASPVIASSFTAAPSPAPSVTPTPAPAAEASLQAAAPDAKPVAVVDTPSASSTKPVLEAESAETRSSSRPAAKQDRATKVAEPSATPVLMAAASPLSVSSALAVSVPVAEPKVAPASPQPSVASSAVNTPASIPGKATSNPLPGTAIANRAVTTQAEPGASAPITGLPAEGLTAIARENGATFQQSLAAQPIDTANARPTQAAVPASAERPLSGVGNQPSSDSATPLPTQTATQRATLPVFVTPPTQEVEPVLREQPGASPLASTAVRPDVLPATAQVQANVPQIQPSVQPQAQPQPSATPHKTAGKQSLPSTSALPSATPVPQTPVQPPASSTDRKPVPYVSAPAVPASASTVAIDNSVAGAGSLPIAHIPVALTALSNPAGPTLAPTSSLAATSTSSTSSTSDSLPHTTLSSTPTTLEVGVASGTHGWLKIRAELNASGTVDASLTGANAAATGKLHNDLPALSSFLQDEKVALGSLNVAAPSGTVSALHATATATLEPTSAFTRSAAEGVGATGTAVASDAGTSGGRAPHQEAPSGNQAGNPADNQPGTSSLANLREDDGLLGAVTPPDLYGGIHDPGNPGALASASYNGGGSWLNVRV